MAKKPFNADQRAGARENLKVTIGGEEFHPARFTNGLRRRTSAIARQAQDKIDSQLQDLLSEQGVTRAEAAGRPPLHPGEDDPDTPRTLLEELEAEARQSEQAQDAMLDSILAQLRELLRGGDREPPEQDFLEEHLDTRDAGELLGWLMSDQDDQEAKPQTPPPTPTPEATGATST